MKRIRLVLLATGSAIALAACGSAGQATIAAPTSTTAAVTMSPPSAVISTTSEVPITATVVVTATAAPASVEVTAPPPVVLTVTQTEQPPPVIVVPDPTTVYQTDYYGQYYSVESLPAGLFCRDLKTMGYSYGDAIAYWNYHAQPSQMDVDLNGIPCETVY